MAVFDFDYSRISVTLSENIRYWRALIETHPDVNSLMPLVHERNRFTELANQCVYRAKQRESKGEWNKDGFPGLQGRTPSDAGARTSCLERASFILSRRNS